jgi:hypothetical protein
MSSVLLFALAIALVAAVLALAREHRLRRALERLLIRLLAFGRPPRAHHSTDPSITRPRPDPPDGLPPPGA